MYKIEGYLFNEKVYENTQTVIYRGTRRKDNLSVIGKFLKARYPTTEDLNRLENEFNIGQTIDNPGVIHYYALENVGYARVIIMEDFGAISLARYMRSRKIGIGEALDIMTTLCDCVEVIHRNNIIHKDINPHNILIAPHTGVVKVTDFSISTSLKKEFQVPTEPRNLKGTLLYLSPEQTGRVNRSIDFRTDFYSLGVTYYELLTGKLPFDFTDPLELIHAHIARHPMEPHKLNPSVPRVLSALVMKLLEKIAEDRYQTPMGLRRDLDECRNQFGSRENIEDFPLAQKDISSRVLIPEKLYGRENEIKLAAAYLDSVAGLEKKILLVSGPTGIGKTSFLNELYNPLVLKGANLVGGKYDQTEKNIPLNGIIQSLDALVTRLMTAEGQEYKNWQECITDALGNNGRILTNLLPRLEMMIGEQPEVPDLPPWESQNRLNLVLGKFIKVFCRREEPLVLLLDDLHWADNASLYLLNSLATDNDLRNLLIIGTYREEDLESTPLLKAFLHKWQEPGPLSKDKFGDIKLKPLDISNLEKLLSDTFRGESLQMAELAAVVHGKTDGNPLFIHEFILKLNREGLLEFHNGWHWHIDKIKKLGITDNVAQLMSEKIESLPQKTLEIVTQAACLGYRFSLDLLYQLVGKEADEVSNLLQTAFEEGVLIKINGYARFAHARVQEATYKLLDPKLREQLHYKTGNLLLKKIEDQDDDIFMFSVVNHLNRAGELLSRSEKDELAVLNFNAGRKAKGAIAYEVAHLFFKTGIRLLEPANMWTENRRLAYGLHLEGGECAYMLGKMGEGEKLFASILSHTEDVMEKVRVFESKLQALIGLQKYSSAMDLGRQALKMLGYPMPGKAGKLKVAAKMLKLFFKFKIHKKGASRVLELPEMKGAEELAVARLLTHLIECSYLADPDYFPYVVLKLLDYTLIKGNSPFSPMVYSVFASVLCDMFGQVKVGNKLGLLSLDLLEKFNARPQRPRVFFVYGAGIRHWNKHMRGDLKYLLEAEKCGMETGDLRFSSYAINGYIKRLFFLGEPLLVVKKEINHYFPLIKRFNQAGSIREFVLWQHLVDGLSGENKNNIYLNEEIPREIDFVNYWRESGQFNRLGFYYLARLLTLFLNESYGEAVSVAREGQQYIETILGDIYKLQFYFYYSLAMTTHYPVVNKTVQKGYSKELLKNLKKMKQWSVRGTENYLCKYLLVLADYYHIRGKAGEAVRLFNRAVILAHKNGFIHEEAMAEEFSARFYLTLGVEDNAAMHIKKAHYLYGLWNNKPKIALLEARYPDQVARVNLENKELQQGAGSSSAMTSNDSSTAPTLDFSAIIRTSQAISSEIVMEKLLGKLMRIVLENAGAQRVVLLIRTHNKLFVEAEGKTDQDTVTVFQHIQLEDSELPQSLARYVERTRELVVLDKSFRDSPFARDPYVQEHQPRSLLCLPVIHQDNLIGILYLENKLSPGLFSAEQQETLKVLAAQAAVALENAMLYENLTQAEEKLRTILDTTNEGFIELNNAGVILDANPAICVITGQDKKDLLGSPFLELLTNNDRESARDQLKLLEQDHSHSYKFTILKPGLIPIHCLVNVTPLFDKDKKKKGAFAMITDLSEYEKKDEQLRQAQKMETVGTLAGGLAHDFNNILGGITGTLSLLQLELEGADLGAGEVEKYLEDMSKSAIRAKEIVQQLLALSRKEELKLEPVDLNDTLAHVENICRNTFDKSVELDFKPYEQPAPVLADPTQLEQILLNMCVNAAHAMTIMKDEGGLWGGRLSVALDTFNADREFCENHRDTEPGFYWELQVSDEGVGMETGVISKIFEPFFTTKVKTRGTGLGLSMVYNLVKQHKGWLEVASESGKGTVFSVYLPEFKEVMVTKKKVEEEGVLKGEGLIMVVDDEPIMRKIAVRALEKSGYRAIIAEDGEKGVALFKKHHQKLKLVLLDMQMPKKSGKETYFEMKAINPDVRVLLTSGFRKDDRVQEVLRNGVLGFIEKPYTFQQLARAVHKVINSERGGNLTG